MCRPLPLARCRFRHPPPLLLLLHWRFIFRAPVGRGAWDGIGCDADAEALF